MKPADSSGLGPLARWVLGAAILLLGAVSATRLEIGYLPAWTFPELDVTLRLPETDELDDLVRARIVPLESAIRAIGGVRDLIGEIDGLGARFTVRLAPGLDAERKAARLESELQSIRRDLPAGSTLRVTPAGQSDDAPSLGLWLEEGISPSEVAEILRAQPSVREVFVGGERRRELRVTARDPGLDPVVLANALEESRSGRTLGRLEGPRGTAVVLARPSTLALADRPVRLDDAVVPLGAVARLRQHRDEPRWQARFGGGAGQEILVFRELDASPLDLSREVRRALAAFGGARLFFDEAEPLLLLLRGLLVGLVVASLFLGVLRGPAHAAVPWLALASSLVAFHLFDRSLDVTTVPALAVAVAVAVLLQPLRGRSFAPVAWIALAAPLPAVAVALFTGPAGALLAPPALAFALAVPVACLGSLLVPAARLDLRPRALDVSRRVLRHAGAVLLAVASGAYLLFVLFGDALQPRAGRLYAPTADLFVQLRFGETATAASASREIARVETHLEGVDEVEEVWSIYDRRRGTVGVRVRPSERGVVRLGVLARRLQVELSDVAASLLVRPLGGFGAREGLRFRPGLGEEPSVSEDLSEYRFLLRATDLAGLVRTIETLGEELQRRSYWDFRAEWMSPDWGAPVPRLELSPRPRVAPGRVREAADALAARARRSSARPLAARLPGDRLEPVVRILASDAPADPDEPPSREALFALVPGEDGAALSPASLFTVRETLGPPTVRREDGRFVVPVAIHPFGLARGPLFQMMIDVHRRLAYLSLPAGVDLERPRLVSNPWTADRARLVALASALPLLFFALLAVRLDSLVYALVAFVPSVAALAVSAPVARTSTGSIEEVSLLALAVAFAAVVPFAGEVVSAVRQRAPSPLGAGRAHHWLGRRLPGVFVAAVAALVLCLVPGWGLAADRHAWVAALRVAGVALFVGTLASVLALPAAVRAVDRFRFRDREAARRRAASPEWQAPGEVSIAVEHLAKVYGDRREGFTALRRVDFELGPGIVGLLGPNGAGKTTLLRLLCGLLEPTRGRVLYRGVPVGPENLPRYRRLVGFLPQSFEAYEGFTVEAFLDYWSIERGLRDRHERRREIERVLDQVALTEVAGRKVRDLSGGMRRRIGIARALLGAPPILIVDEPTTGLDVESRNRLREALLTVATERIVLFSTHIASDVAAAASRILLLDHGRLLFDGPSSRLIEEAEGRVFESLVADADLRDFSARYRVTTRVRTLEGLRVRAVAAPGQEPPGPLVRPNLEEAYLAKLGLGPQGEGARRTESLLDLDLWRS